MFHGVLSREAILVNYSLSPASLSVKDEEASFCVLKTTYDSVYKENKTTRSRHKHHASIGAANPRDHTKVDKGRYEFDSWQTVLL